MIDDMSPLAATRFRMTNLLYLSIWLFAIATFSPSPPVPLLPARKHTLSPTFASTIVVSLTTNGVHVIPLFVDVSSDTAGASPTFVIETVDPAYSAVNVSPQ
jgi:hypothetical protein